MSTLMGICLRLPNWAITGVAIAGAVLSLIFSFGAASPLAIGLGITGGLLGLGSAGTQAASLATTGKTSETLSYISLGLGSASDYWGSSGALA